MAEPKPRSLAELFAPPAEGVLIPIVQRDYAQGRPGAGEVRKRFLDALFVALDQAGPDRPPLDLDFVYGYFGQDSGSFVPIDGQQRLTTLFLLHWYLAQLDGQVEDFQRRVVHGRKARFQYAVRSSSDDFLEELARCELELTDLLPADRGRANALSKTLRDQHWYFRAWERDPTVRSCLTMLDAIHETFGHSSGFYDRLVGPRPAITFQFLNLDEFGLGDELYIKMNARGRPLTDFEVFKSEVEKFARNEPSLPKVQRNGRTLPMYEHLGIQLDTTWSHLLWALLRAEHAESSDDAWTRLLDPQLLNLMRTLAIVTHPDVDATGDEAEKVEKWLEELHNGWVTSFPGYQTRRTITADWVAALASLMDLWSGAGEQGPELNTFLERTAYYDEAAMFRRVREDKPRRGTDTRKPDGAVTYTHLVRFAGYCLFLRADLDRQDLDDCMRVMTNLARNSVLTDGDTLRRALRGIRRLLPSVEGGVLAHLAANGKVDGFLRQQVREEQLKAQLIQRSDDWRKLIERAELHRYFLGQIEFLFDFSGVLEAWSTSEQATWSENEDATHRAAFEVALRRAEAAFGRPGGGLTKLPEFLWERALLCQGDYTIRPTSGQSRSLGINTLDAKASWKVLLRGDAKTAKKRELMRAVFDRLDPDDLVGSLREIVDGGVVDGRDEDSAAWRAVLVENPELLEYCKERWLLWDWHEDDKHRWWHQVFLVKGKRRGSYLEVMTWDAAQNLIADHQAGRLAPFREPVHVEGSGAAIPPCIELYLPKKKKPSYRVTHYGHRFRVVALSSGRAEQAIDCPEGKLRKRLRKLAASLVEADA